jgi:hypothetical protein
LLLGSNNPLANSEIAVLLTLFAWETGLLGTPLLASKVITFPLPPEPPLPPVPPIIISSLELLQEVIKIVIID